MTIEANTPARRTAWVALAALTLTNALAQSGATVLSAVLPLLKAEFGYSDAQLGLLTGYASAVAYAVLALPVSMLAAKYGSSLVLAISMALYSVANLLTAGCSAFWHFVGARFLAGLGPAASWPLGQALVADHFGPRQRSGAMATYTAGDFLGGTLPLVIGGWVAAQYGWRMAFAVFAVAGVVVALLQWRFAPDVAKHQLPTETTPQGEPGAIDIAMLPGLRALWRERTFVHLVMGFSWASFAVYGLSSWMPSFYNRQFGLAPDEAAAFFGGAYAGGALLGLLLGGWAGNLLGAGRQDRLLLFCMGTYLMTFPCILGVLFAPSLGFAFAAHVLATMFGAMPNGPVLSMVHGSVARPLRVLASSVFLLAMTLLGAGGGPFLIGLMSDALAASRGAESLKFAMLGVKLLGLMLFIHLGLAWIAERRSRRLQQAPLIGVAS